MMSRPLLVIAALTLNLSACSAGTGEGATTTETPDVVASSAAAESPGTTAPTVSANKQFVTTFVEALDVLEIKHSEPQRTEAGLLSKASYDLTVNGYDASIQVFATEETQAAWEEASDSLGGVCVVIDGAALSLNSSTGIADSVEIAPQIAQEVGGEARGT